MSKVVQVKVKATGAVVAMKEHKIHPMLHEVVKAKKVVKKKEVVEEADEQVVEEKPKKKSIKNS